MAACMGVCLYMDNPFIYINLNIVSTTLIVKLAAKLKIENLIFTSSSIVYNGSNCTHFSKDKNVDNPVSPNTVTKKGCKLLAYTYHHLYKLNVPALHFFTVYNLCGRPDMVLYQFVDKISQGVKIQKFRDSSSSRDYTYISNIVNGVVRSIDRQYPYQVFNIGREDGISLNEFIGNLGKAHGHDDQGATIAGPGGGRPIHLGKLGEGQGLFRVQCPSVV